MINYLNRIINFGVRHQDDFYESRLKRAVNILSLNGLFCIGIASFYGIFIEGSQDSFILLGGIFLYALVFYFNAKNRVHLGITTLFATGSILLTIFSIRSGEASFTHSLFILNIIGLSLLYRKGKIRFYYYLNMLFTLLCLVFVMLSFQNNWFAWFENVSTEPEMDRRINLFFLIFCSLLFSIVVVSAFSMQFTRLKKSVEDKEVLLAELNHRVKNNLSIIISLLRLKQDISTHQETKDALLEIGNRIHSMALVHTKMYEGNGRSFIDVRSYIDDLMDGICASLAKHPNISCSKKIDESSLDVSTAIPVGMILNELIMNSLKHAFAHTDVPKIDITYLVDGNKRTLRFHDNGSGMDTQQISKSDSLGMEIIHSLTEQIDGKCSFTNDNGVLFELTFTVDPTNYTVINE